MEEPDLEKMEDYKINMEVQSNPKSSIKRIDKGTVHNICSGQVITSLRSAVKELVENSLDAGATSVEVHLCDHGTTSIEVIDNGAGVPAEDFEAVGLKHHTSKLREFADLPGVGTFGFRGEALGSLCALAEVSMVTRHRSAPVATRLKFDVNGRISEQTPAARQVGTTVTVRQLFSRLPVRRRQFCGRARREVTDLLQLLWGYALVVSSVRLVCTQQSKDGRRSVLLSSPAGATLSERAAALFGQKQAASLLPLRAVPPSEETRAEFGLGTAGAQPEVTVEGLVSSCEHGKGRGAADRQFIAINGRPCDHTKISRLANEVYRGYNRHQSPLLVLSVTLSREQVDVNVTPDKRMLFVQNEKYLLSCVKESLTQCFENLPSSYKVTSLAPPSQLPASGPPVTSPSARVTSLSPSGPSGDWISAIRRSAKKTSAPAPTTADSSSSSKRQCLDRFFRRVPAPAAAVAADGSDGSVTFTGRGSPARLPVPAAAAGNDGAEASTVRPRIPSDVQHICGGDGDSGAAEAVAQTDDALGTDSDVPYAETPGASESPPPLPETDCLPLQGACDGLQPPSAAGGDTQEWPAAEEDCVDRVAAEGDGSETPAGDTSVSARTAADDFSGSEGRTPVPAEFDRVALAAAGDFSGSEGRTPGPAEFDRVASSDSGFVESSQDGENFRKSRRRRARLPFSMADLRRQVAEMEGTTASESADGEPEWRFRAAIKPSDNSAAEEELNLQIKKEDFLKMRVVGQFNLGFMVTQLGRDLFLIDQHATDEKYNFERLSRQPLSKQPLVVPQDLELPAVSEETLLSQPEVFSAAGFHVTEDPEAPPGRRLRLLAAPAVQGVVCGKSDLEELIWLVQESPGPLTALRPSRVRAVLASRACRTSVMIGTALSPAGMARLVHHMAEMDHPWNCPHGRPTMRHLVCLNMLQSS